MDTFYLRRPGATSEVKASASSAVEQLREIRKERARSYHGIPQESPVEVGRSTDSDDRASASGLPNATPEGQVRQRGFLQGVARQPSERPSGSLELNECSLEEHEARDMLEHSNCFRQCEGKGVLVWNRRLAKIAGRAALRMARWEVPFSHCGADERFAEYPLGHGDTYGENLARSQGIRPMAKTVVDGWIGSPGHCRNLLGPFSACGIGAATNPEGITFVVQLFALVPAHSDIADETEATAPLVSPVRLSSLSTSFLFLLALVALLLWKGGWMPG
eukprot:TRINITY_DN59963_c0_g1_i1.p1 TRINITY_DN59963_c0_g1~~TRINITY_DN59963_c0_g1_i1.p1  ORF type:complete len:276 (+),score=20.40 TRINITY_DN59963_c0_g1_i1:174-1001(+)